MNIKETALRLGIEIFDESPYDEGHVIDSGNKWIDDKLIAFAEALVAELAKENKPVAWMYEYSYDLNGDKQGHWPVEMYTHVSFSRSKPSVESTPIYTLPPTAEQIEQETAEAIAKMLHSNANKCYLTSDAFVLKANASLIIDGAWKKYK